MRIRSHIVALCAALLAAPAGAQSLRVAAGASLAPGASGLSSSFPWTDLGGGLAGATGIPVLAGTGVLSPGTPGSLELSGSATSAPCAIFFSLLEVAVPFKGGTLSAFPPIGTYFFVTNPTGGLLLPWGSWTSSLPAGLDMYFQMAVADAGAPKNAAISNLLQGVTQP